jgi:hypothetical protein
LDALAVGPLKLVIHKDNAPEKYVIAVHASDTAPSGPRSGTIYIMTASEDEPIVAVPVYFRMGESVVATPDHLVFEANGGQQQIELRSVAGDTLRITNVRFEDDVIRASIVRDTQTAKEAASIDVAPAVRPSTKKAATILVIETDCPSAREVYVPVLVR